MQFKILFFLLIASCLCLALAQVSYEDCCLKHTKMMAPQRKKYIVAYREQITDGGCNIAAIIFITKKGRTYCTNPRERWVKDLMTFVDKKQKKGNKIPNRKHTGH